MTIVYLYSLNAFDEAKTAAILKSLQEVNKYISAVQTEKCYYIELNNELVQISDSEEKILKWLLATPLKEQNLIKTSKLTSESSHDVIIEIGPRLNFSTPDSTNSVNICQNLQFNIKRFEVSVKYKITFDQPNSKPISNFIINELVEFLSDRMTQCQYTSDNIPLNSFYEKLTTNKTTWNSVPLLTEGKVALIKVNKKLGLAFDDWDMEYYINLFTNILKRNPTEVELFDLAQSNSEHSRHWFFKGKMIIDNKCEEKSLIQMIIDTQKYTNNNNTIKFSDNSSAINGFQHNLLRADCVTGPGKMIIKNVQSNLIFTAETHNMPTAVSPFSGATTGTGGRIRDVQGVGRGGLTIAGTAGYCVGNLNIPGYNLSYESSTFEYPTSFASPLKIIIEASNGASDYGNKFGEPVISGFAISYGLLNSMNNRDEYVKPIMFSAGLGIMNAKHTDKIKPTKGMLLAKIGGPVYRIGVGGGAASSVEVQGDNCSELDFNAVQRGDAEMENKLNRVVRACIELDDKNPIIAIHDQGAGGNGNVLKELVEPNFAGAIIFSKEFELGDPTITILELWGAEYQENNAILCKAEDRQLLEDICARERCPISFVGMVTGDGYVSLIETEANFEKYPNREAALTEFNNKLPFDMNLKDVLGEMPRKEYQLKRIPQTFLPLDLPPTWDYNNFLNNVLSVLSVGSKRFLTNKVDRCVTGLVAQQQCVGPLHTPLSDYGLTAISHFGYEGIATSIGTQPLKGLISAKAGARMSVAEAITNLVFVGITSLADVKCSGNWMWAAKLPGEGAKMYDACREMCEIMKELNIGIDGGKDSLSMASRVKGETVKSPGTLVISTYAPCPDIRVKITPDLKSPSLGKKGELIWINIEGLFRLGGSALAQTFGQQGCNAPSVDKTDVLKNAFEVTQNLLKSKILLAGHDISDGGLIVCLLEMAFAGLCGLEINLDKVAEATKLGTDPMFLLFAEEAGWVLEIESQNLSTVLKAFESKHVPAYHIGNSQGYGITSQIKISFDDRILIKNTNLILFKQWERTSYEIEKLQMNSEMAIEEYSTYDYRTGPKYHCTFNPDDIILTKEITTITPQIRVAVIREEGINGDREMIATLIKANFEVYDITMFDLIENKITLDQFRGIIFPGGFSYADTLGSAKGWAASIKFHTIKEQFELFKKRANTFSLGVCNGCQLMSYIGYLETSADSNNIALLENKSERFECRWATLKIPKNKSIMLGNMTGTTIGCWVAHGEGRFAFKNCDVQKKLQENECITMNYVDDNGEPTEIYPLNPNGSPDGIAGICSDDGRHLAIMPHPERCSLMWQWPYVPADFNYKISPWQRMFDEAYLWCIKH